MNDDHLHDDLDLAGAFRSVRETYDGTNAESNLTLQRALFRTRARERKQRFARWVVLPAAAVLVASSAWAGMTGRLAPAVQTVLETFHSERTASPPPARAPSHAALPPSAADTATSVTAEMTEAPASAEPVVTEVPTAEAPSPPPAPAPETTTSPPFASSHPIAAARPSSVAHASAPALPSHTIESPRPVEPAHEPVPSPSASAADPHAALFAEAHRLHFAERDPARALAAWDRYLAVAPNGRFAPEARYNRALALVRLGRHAEARSELAAFASGTYGSYRREDAKALLAALASDASPP